MAQRRRGNSGGSDASKSVALRDKSGNEVAVSNPASFNQLVYGEGYLPVNRTVNEAYRKLVSQDAESSGNPVPLVTE